MCKKDMGWYRKLQSYLRS